MRILLLSDSHGKPLSEIDFTKYDYSFHCGDYGHSYDELIENNVNFVRGNCDFEAEKIKTVEICGKMIALTHGDLYGVKYGYTNLTYFGEGQNANLVFFGHTHRQAMFEVNDITYINPGAYMDGCYVEITDDKIIFFQNKKKIKEYNYRW